MFKMFLKVSKCCIPNMMIFLFLTCLLIGCSQQLRFTYPKVARNESEKEIKFGIQVSDPYRWLEKLDTKERKDLIEAQNKLTQSYLNGNKDRAEIKKGITELTNYEKFGLPSKVGGKFYFEHNSGLQSQPIIYQADSLYNLTNASIFLDPNTMSEDGSTYLTFYSFSPDGKWIVYGTNEGGGDWMKFRIRNVKTGNELNETLIKIKFITPSWSGDSLGFFYSYFDEYKGKPDARDSGSPKNMKVFYHRLNTDQSQDILIAKFPNNPLWTLKTVISNDGKYILIEAKTGAGFYMFYSPFDSSKPVTKGAFNFTKVYDDAVEVLNYVTNNGSTFYFLTSIDAPNNRVVRFDITNASKANWHTIIPEHNRDVLYNANPIGGDYIALHHLHDVSSKLSLHKLIDGSFVLNFTLPLGAISGASGYDGQVFYSMASFLNPYVIYSFDFNKTPFQNKVIKQSNVKGLDPTQFVSKQVFYLSKDGTKIPMFLIHRKGLNFNSSLTARPALLYGYGGFRSILLENYNVLYTYFVKNLDGVVAVANLRGGAEYGERWHKTGMLLNKQNVFDDFHWAAKYLIANNYTTPNLLTIHGHSNGGTLVGATANQRPDLYGCAIAKAGVMDMLRFHMSTMGYMSISEYGNPDKEVDFKNLIKYSPLHNVPKSGKYPATLIATSDHDDRVIPAHSLKFISQLQHNLGEKLSNSTPFMLRLDKMTGHGDGMSTAKQIEENTDFISFITNSIKIPKWNRFV